MPARSRRKRNGTGSRTGSTRWSRAASTARPRTTSRRDAAPARGRPDGSSPGQGERLGADLLSHPQHRPGPADPPRTWQGLSLAAEPTSCQDHGPRRPRNASRPRSASAPSRPSICRSRCRRVGLCSGWTGSGPRGAAGPRRLHRDCPELGRGGEAGDGNDYSVCTTWAVTRGNVYRLLDVTRVRAPYHRSCPRPRAHCRVPAGFTCWWRTPPMARRSPRNWPQQPVHHPPDPPADRQAVAGTGRDPGLRVGSRLFPGPRNGGWLTSPNSPAFRHPTR